MISKTLSHPPNRKQEKNKNSLTSVVRPRDESVFVSGDVKNCPPPKHIGIVVYLLHLRRCLPRSRTYHRIPRFQARLRIRMDAPKALQCSALDDALRFRL